jgi:hypothetical protein
MSWQSMLKKLSNFYGDLPQTIAYYIFKLKLTIQIKNKLNYLKFTLRVFDYNLLPTNPNQRPLIEADSRMRSNENDKKELE